MNIIRKIIIVALVVVMLCSYGTVFAVDNTAVEINLMDLKAHSFDANWNGLQGTVTIGEAIPVNPQPRFNYDLTEGVGTWTRRIFYTLGIWNFSYTVRYTINSNYRVTIHDMYNFSDGGVGGIELVEDMIVNATETSQYPAECFATWRVTIGIDSFSIGDTITVRCRFQNNVLRVMLG